MTSMNIVMRIVMRIAIYCRISKDDKGYALGVHDQVKQARELIGQRWPDAEIVVVGCECRDCGKFGVPADVYCDNDITAAGKRRRPHYERLLADMDAGRIDVVVATHTDRLHRHPMELEGYIDASERHHVQTHTTKGTQLDLNTSTGRMVARMLGAAARHEWERMVERQKDAKRRTREAGLHGGGSRPFGYDFDARDDRGSQIPGVSAGLTVRSQPAGGCEISEAAAVRDGYAKLLAGVNLTKIGDEWNAAGLRTPATARRGGGPWKSDAVRRVLLNGINAGLVVYQEPPRTGPRAKRGAYVVAGEGKWEALVTPDTWRAAKAILTDPARRTGPGPAPRNLLTGVLICGVCGGRRFGVTRSTSSGRPAYTCRTWRYRDDATGRRHLSREADRLDAWVESIVIELLSRPDVVAALNTRPDVDIGALNARRAGINAELEEWARTPGITPRQLQIKNEPLLAGLAEVDRQISEGLRGDPLPELAGSGNDPAAMWAALKDAGNIERMRAIVALTLRVRLLPGRKGNPKGYGKQRGRRPFDYDAVEILPPDA